MTEEANTQPIMNNSVTPSEPQANSTPTQAVEENASTQVITEKQPEMSAGSEQVTDNVTENVTTNPDTQPATDAGTSQPTETLEDLRRQLDEYRARDEELKELSTRLGTDKVQDPQFIEAQKQLDIIDNQAQQAYISLCNQYGVDYRPENIEKSANELKSKDPQAYYELQHRLGQLDSVVSEKRNEVNAFIKGKQIDIALNRHNNILNASPALKQQLSNYLSMTELYDPNTQIDSFISMAMPIQREAFEYGKIIGRQEAMKQTENPNTILNNNVAVQNTPYQGQAPRVFTREEIAKMSQAEFEAHEKEIDLAYREGRIK